ncbi:SH3 domain-containing protein [Streptomyces sp. HNM0574]|uniref:SH3 domain-containing protein n=1 Tax=Streptomyces sp. HNM0574 TaxID=2714954 RepID=UPI0032176C25
MSAVASGVLGASLLGAGLAQAAPSDIVPGPTGEEASVAAHKPVGTVVSRSGLNVRDHPTTHSKVVGFLKYKQRVGLACKTKSQNVDGNRIWYKLRYHNHNWVAARYVKNDRPVRWCKVTRAEQEATQNAQQQATPESVAPKG